MLALCVALYDTVFLPSRRVIDFGQHHELSSLWPLFQKGFDF